MTSRVKADLNASSVPNFLRLVQGSELRVRLLLLPTVRIHLESAIACTNPRVPPGFVFATKQVRLLLSCWNLHCARCQVHVETLSWSFADIHSWMVLVEIRHPCRSSETWYQRKECPLSSARKRLHCSSRYKRGELSSHNDEALQLLPRVSGFMISNEVCNRELSYRNRWTRVDETTNSSTVHRQLVNRWYTSRSVKLQLTARPQLCYFLQLYSFASL